MPGLCFRDIRKAFGAVQALAGVTFDVEEAEAHAVVGENGAGKSTLLKVLAGLVRPDAGHITWRGARLDHRSPREALERGIGMVYQEIVTFPNLSVAGNIFAGRELTRHGRLLERDMHDRTRLLLGRLRLNIDPASPAESLSAAHRQLLQVARALAFECRILVLDEPTTALTDAEAGHLFDVLRELKRHGTTVLYVSHRLPEVFRLCDRVTVLRDGALVGTHHVQKVAPHEIVKAMVGRELGAMGAHGSLGATGVVRGAGMTDVVERRLDVRELGRAPHFRNVSFHVARGEIVALFGLVGSGRSELLETLFGLHRPSAGDIRLDDQPVRFGSARQAARAGIALVPEERQRQGLLFNLTLRHNLVIPRHVIAGDRVIRTAAERSEAQRQLHAWRIKAPHAEVMLDSLSGGNQQKVVAAKWLATKPRVLLLDEPTKGVDVGAKFEIHELIRREAVNGMAVLVVSSDLPEVLALANRVLVMREGRLSGELSAVDATEEAVMRLATAEVIQAS